MNRKQKIRLAVYAAKQVLHIFEEKHPNDKRPRNAINAAIKCVNNPSELNKQKAHAAAYAAYAAYAAAAYAAYAAAYAAYAAYAAAAAAADAAYAADAAAARVKLREKIIRYAVKLLERKV